jgi:PEP-CTERM motif
MKFALKILVSIGLGVVVASAGSLTYTCDPSIGAATCNYLNTTIAGLYNSTFTNLNADIYITYGTTGLGSGENPINAIPYSTYLSDYATNAAASGNPNQATALTSLNNYATPVYSGTSVQISGALGEALGISASDLLGFDSAGNSGCTLSSAGCYEDVLTITSDPSTLLFYRSGSIDPDAYDFYSVVEHETDEAFGTVSCIETQDPTLMNNCDGNESAADLFRYQSFGNLIPDSSLSTTPGAYLSYNGGVTNALGTGVFYNTLSNGDDYGDFVGSYGCPTAPYIQDGEGCPGFAGLDITNDGGAEINMLNTVGFDLNTSAVPEPSTFVLIGAGLGILGILHRRFL